MGFVMPVTLLACFAQQLETAGSICKTFDGGWESPKGDLADEARNLSCRA